MRIYGWEEEKKKKKGKEKKKKNMPTEVLLNDNVTAQNLSNGEMTLNRECIYRYLEGNR